jgi:hypothetical protein
VLATEHLLGLAGVDLAGEVVERAREILGDGLAGFDPFRQHAEVFDPPLERLGELAILFEAAAALQQLLRARLILPEVRCRDAFFDSGQLFGRACGVKDSSAGQRRGGPGPDVCEAARRGESSW